VSIADLLSELRGRGIELSLAGEKVVSRAPKGALTPELAAALRERRDELRAFLEAAQREAALAAVPPLRPVERAEFMPVSFSQERLWYLTQVEKNPAVYNLPLCFRLTGPLRVDVLQRCLDEIEARHEALRTTIVAVEGRAMQRIHPPAGMPLAHFDVQPDHASGAAPGVEALLAQEAMRAFDLATGPLVRASLCRSAEREHYLLVVMHHVISDGISTQVMVRDLAALYEAFAAGRPSPLTLLPIQFADWAVWQRSWLHGPALEEQLSWWRRRLQEPLPVLDLPTDFPRPAIRTSNGAKEPLKLASEVVGRLTNLARAEGATTFMALLALWKLLLLRHTGQEDLIVGTPVANRSRAEVEGVVGFVANTLVLRTSLEGNPSWREVVRRVRDTCAGAFRYQDMPFQKIVEAINPPRDLSRTPIFQAFFTFHEITSQASRMGDVELHPFVAGSNVSRMDLALFLRELEGGILGSLEYNTDLFSRDRILRMNAHFQALAEAAAREPDAPAGRLVMLTGEEQRAYAGLNATGAECPGGLIQDLVAAAAGRDPAAPAVRSGRDVLSYAALEERSHGLAVALRERGVGDGDLVGVCLERRADLPVALLGVLKAGAAWVPLDPDFPPQRLDFMARDAGLRLVIAHRSCGDRLPAAATDILWLDDLTPAPHGAAAVTTASPDSRAYVIHTSGSTGRPKGVEVTHRNVVNFLAAMRRRPGMSRGDVLVAVTTLSFDISGLELLLPLVSGGTLVVAPREIATAGARLAALLEEVGATVMQATPATWRLLLDAGWSGRPGLRALCGGEALPQDLAASLLPMVGELWNMYGPTETTIWSTCAKLEAGGPVTIGTPIANTVCRVIDRFGSAAPLGVPGELYIGGAGVAAGYLGRDDLTAERFGSDPCGELPEVRFYRTGDLVRLRSDGRLEHFGRLDDQVKVQGYRIELGEVEAALAENPAVVEAVASVYSDHGGDARLVAYVVYREGQQQTVSEVRRMLRERLPAYMVPGLVVQLDAIPRNASGKVDRRALPNPLGSPAVGRRHEPPLSEAERLIARAWASLLEVEAVGRQDNFFELGGHSLLSMRAVAAIERESGVHLDPRLMFFQTVEQIAANLERRLTVVV
jgi:amino acid adenylation domain-containing protein